MWEWMRRMVIHHRRRIVICRKLLLLEMLLQNVYYCCLLGLLKIEDSRNVVRGTWLRLNSTCWLTDRFIDLATLEVYSAKWKYVDLWANRLKWDGEEAFSLSLYGSVFLVCLSLRRCLPFAFGSVPVCLQWAHICRYIMKMSTAQHSSETKSTTPSPSQSSWCQFSIRWHKVLINWLGV